jgi:hypothetical protein
MMCARRAAVMSRHAGLEALMTAEAGVPVRVALLCEISAGALAFMAAGGFHAPGDRDMGCDLDRRPA